LKLEQIRKETTCISLIPTGFQTLLDAKEKLKIMFKDRDNAIKGCGMDQFDENREELCLKQIYAQATHQFGVAIEGCCEAIILAFGESFISTPTGCWCSFLPNFAC